MCPNGADRIVSDCCFDVSPINYPDPEKANSVDLDQTAPAV